MAHAIRGTIGAALLISIALLAEAQTEKPGAPAPASSATPAAAASAVQPVSRSLGLLVYPAKGQSSAQQSVDEQECYNWAKAQTGIDPQAPAPVAAVPQEPKQGGQRVRGAARGAAAGAVIGEVANDDASEGAKVGAAAGVVAGGRNAREDKRAHEEQAKTQEQAAQTERASTFKKAVGTCLQGRGYTTG